MKPGRYLMIIPWATDSEERPVERLLLHEIDPIVREVFSTAPTPLGLAYTLASPKDPLPEGTSPETVILQAKYILPPELRAQAGEWRDRLHAAIVPLQSSVPLARCFVEVANYKPELFGGPQGFDLADRLDCLGAQALLACFSSSSPSEYRSRGSAILRATEMGLAILRALDGDRSAKEAAAGLRRWCEIYVSICEKDGGTLPRDLILEQARALATPLRDSLSREVEDSDSSAWTLPFQAFSNGLEELAPQGRAARAEIDRHWPWPDWLGRRVIHLNFLRQRLPAVHECSALLSLASLLENNEVKW